MKIFSIHDKYSVHLIPASAPEAPVIYLNSVSEEATDIYNALRHLGCPDLSLVSVTGLCWNRDLSPWESQAVFRNGEAFEGGADQYLSILTKEILPEAEKHVMGPPSWRGIAGYSLAGLFALYSLFRTDAFSRAASMSGSLWFPGFTEYVRSNAPISRPDRVYLSLGDKESRTKNPVLQTVLKDTEDIRDHFLKMGTDTIFKMEAGNHFVNERERIISGLCWLLKR